MSETRSAPVKPIDAEPVAWLHVDGVSVISNKVKDLWIKVRSAQVENYTTPLFKANREPFVVTMPCVIEIKDTKYPYDQPVKYYLADKTIAAITAAGGRCV